MKKNLVFLITLFTSVAAFSQLPVWHGDFALTEDSIQPTDYVNVVSEYEVNSNTITNQLFNQLGDSPFLSEDDKERELNNVKNNVRLGLVLDAAVWYKHKLKKKNINLVVNFRSRSFRTIQINGDVLELALNGNTGNEDKTVNFSPTKTTHYIHQEVYFGAEKLVDKIGLLVGGGVALQKLAYHRELELKGSLYTAPYGKYIDYDIQYVDQETRSVSENNFKRNEGLGLTINAYAVKKINNNSRFGVEIKDVGFINVGDVQEYKVDTAGRWDGVYINDVIGEPTVSGDFPTTDQINESRKPKKLTTTGSINASYFTHITPKISGYIGVKQFFTSAYLPRIYARPYYEVCKIVSVGLPIAYGGFGKFDVGLSFKGKVFKNYSYVIDVNYLESLLIPEKSSGQGFNFGLSAMF